MSRETDAVDRVATAHAKMEAKNARQAQRQQTLREMDDALMVSMVALAVVLVTAIITAGIWLLNRGPDDTVITREKNFQTCVEEGGTFVPITSEKYACIRPPAP